MVTGLILKLITYCLLKKGNHLQKELTLFTLIQGLSRNKFLNSTVLEKTLEFSSGHKTRHFYTLKFMFTQVVL